MEKHVDTKNQKEGTSKYTNTFAISLATNYYDTTKNLNGEISHRKQNEMKAFFLIQFTHILYLLTYRMTYKEYALPTTVFDYLTMALILPRESYDYNCSLSLSDPLLLILIVF